MQLSLIPDPPREAKEIRPDCWLIPDFMKIRRQTVFLKQLREWGKGLMHTPVMPNGVKMNHPIYCLGWDWNPYQYSAPKVEMPAYLQAIAYQALTNVPGHATSEYRQHWDALHCPDTAVVNWFPLGSRLGSHVDNSEDYRLIEAGSPIITIALGSSAIMAIGGELREDKMLTFEMRSGDLMVMMGKARRYYHEVRRIIPDSAPLGLELKEEGRISVTMRRAQYNNESIQPRRY